MLLKCERGRERDGGERHGDSVVGEPGSAPLAESLPEPMAPFHNNHHSLPWVYQLGSWKWPRKWVSQDSRNRWCEMMEEERILSRFLVTLPTLSLCHHTMSPLSPYFPSLSHSPPRCLSLHLYFPPPMGFTGLFEYFVAFSVMNNVLAVFLKIKIGNVISVFKGIF